METPEIKVGPESCHNRYGSQGSGDNGHDSDAIGGVVVWIVFVPSYLVGRIPSGDSYRRDDHANPSRLFPPSPEPGCDVASNSNRGEKSTLSGVTAQAMKQYANRRGYGSSHKTHGATDGKVSTRGTRATARYQENYTG